MPNTPIIRYYVNYDQRAEHEKQSFQIVPAGGGERIYHDVAYAFGYNIEFLIRETFLPLEEVREMRPGGWPPIIRFEKLKHVLKGDAREAYDEIVENAYPNAADKTNPAYEELRRQIITKLSDHEYPGDKVKTYLQSTLRYEKCKAQDGSGRVEQPNKVLMRINRIRRMAEEFMHHNHGAVFMTEDEVKHAFWHCFPDDMKDWLTNDENIDPFDPANPLTAQEIADHLQRYWNKHFKKRGRIEGEDEDRDETKATKVRRVESSDDSEEDLKEHDQEHEDECRDEEENKHSRKTRRGDGDRRSKTKSSEACPIASHKKYRHDWCGCFLNPYSFKFNETDAEKFYEFQARGIHAWYRDVYENASRNRDVNREDRERGSQGSGRGYYNGGRGFQGGRGGGRGGGGRGYFSRGGGGRGGYHASQGQMPDQHNFYPAVDRYSRSDGDYEGGMGEREPEGQYHYGLAPAAPAAPATPAFRSSYAQQRKRF